MYNLTVATAHTFFVGDGQWLVHNACRKPTQSHHIIPQALDEHDFVRYASEGGWNNNAKYNRIELPASPQAAINSSKGLPVHRGRSTAHRSCSSDIEDELDRMWATTKQAGWSPTKAKQELFRLAIDTRYNIWNTGKLVAK